MANPNPIEQQPTPQPPAPEPIAGPTTFQAGAPPSVPSTPAPAPESPMRALFTGYGLTYENDQAAADMVARMVQNAGEMREFADLGRQVAPHYDKIRPIIEATTPGLGVTGGPPPSQPTAPQPAAQVPQADQPAAPPFSWDVPKVDNAWYSYCYRDPTSGQWASQRPEYAAYAHRLNEYENWQRSTANRVFTEFPALVQQSMDARLGEMEKRIEERAQQIAIAVAMETQTANAQRTWLSQHLGEFFRLAPDGRPVQDPVTQQPIQTPRGDLFSAVLARVQRTVTDPVEAREQAYWMTLGIEQSQAQVAGVSKNNGDQQTPSTPAPTKQESFLQRATRGKSSRSGTIPSPASPPTARQNPEARNRELIAAVAEKQGLDLRQ